MSGTACANLYDRGCGMAGSARFARRRFRGRLDVDALQEAKDVLRQGGTPTPAGRRQADSADVEPAAEAAPDETR